MRECEVEIDKSLQLDRAFTKEDFTAEKVEEEKEKGNWKRLA
jgi:hypothetical protein